VWPRLPDATDRLIFVVADPDNLVPEFDEDDNSTFQTLAILSLPDLAVSPASLVLDPPFPLPDQQVTLTVTLSNLGEQGADAILVRAYDGDPASGGTQVGGDQTVGRVDGLGSGVAAFTWVFNGSEPRPIVVQVDPANTIEEGAEDNNTAQISVTAQDSDFFVTNRYFSPNGDGVKDDTTLFYRLETSTDAQVEVEDSRGEIVRRSEVMTGASGSFPWDGLDERGRLVRDGDYLLRLTGGGAGLPRQALVSLDTDRSSLLEAVGTPYEFFRNLTCELDNIWDIQTTADEEFLYFYAPYVDDPITPRGIYRMASTGAEIQTLVPLEFFELPNTNPPRYTVANNLKVNATATHLAFEKSYEVWFADGLGNGLNRLDVPFNTDLIGFAEDGETLVVSRTDNDTLEAHPLDGFTPPRVLFQSTGYFPSSPEPAFSPDGTKLVFREYSSSGYKFWLLDIPPGESVELISQYYAHYAWSPTSTRLAMTDTTSGQDRVLVFDGDGNLISTVEPPVDPYPEDLLPPDSPTAPNPEVDNIERPTWSSNGEEFGLYVRYEDDDTYTDFGRLFVVDALTGVLDEVGITRLDDEDSETSYHVETWDGQQWIERGVLSYGLHYREQELDLSSYLPDVDGELKVRIWQTGREAAHVDHVALIVRGEGFLPARAVRLDTGDDLLPGVLYPDFEVIDLWERGMELSWSDVPNEDDLRLSLIAREETLSNRRARPFRYPAETGRVYDLALAGDGPLVVDGQQTASDGLSGPLFEVWSRPDTGHPRAVVVGYAKSDAEHLYAALDFTVDNTLYESHDWAELQVKSPQGWRHFRITADDTTYGHSGFTRTGRVHHTHKYYEFKIPLAEIDAASGDVVSVAFEAYGTAALLDDEASELLPLWGDLFWVPNERSLLYTTTYDERTAILMDEENRQSSSSTPGIRPTTPPVSVIGGALTTDGRSSHS
jgi:hypothetical protein